MSCCSPQRPSVPESNAAPEGIPAHGAGVEHVSIDLPGGSFAMGDAFGEGYAADGETPVHEVTLSPFSVDAYAVTNRQFAAFAESTGYRTDSEKYGSSAVFHLAFKGEAAEVIAPVPGVPWWLNVRGASWRNPAGSHSSYLDVLDHPVVHVSHFDAFAYCSWAGRSLPTEAQWEYMARGGLSGARYAWGDELEPGGEHRCNIWQGDFPRSNTQADGFLTTAPVGTFEPNGFGVFQSAGNVWEWCADWFLPKYYATCERAGTVSDPEGPTIGNGRVMRGGSYLCHDSYCNRYRVAARSHNSPDSASGNVGFRTVSTASTVVSSAPSPRSH